MERASDLLVGRRILLIGDSVARRHLWALVDAVRGAKADRRRTRAPVDNGMRLRNTSHALANALAIREAVGDLMYDEALDRHQSQTVLLNVRTKSMVYLSGPDICKLAGFSAAVDRKACIRPNGIHARHWTTSPYETGLKRAVKRNGMRLQASQANASLVLTTLTWLYASSAVTPLSIVREFGPLSIGVRADATIFGVDHTAVIHPQWARPYLVSASARAQARAWTKLLAKASMPGKMCHPPAVCLVRGVVHNAGCENDTLYQNFAQEASRAAAAPGARFYYLDVLNGTLDGIRSHAFEHPDLLRIHYNDRGREFLAQMLLNALAATMLRLSNATTSNERSPLLDGQPAILRLQQPAPAFRNVWDACAAAERGKRGGAVSPSLLRECESCGGCRERDESSPLPGHAPHSKSTYSTPMTPNDE